MMEKKKEMTFLFLSIWPAAFQAGAEWKILERRVIFHLPMTHTCTWGGGGGGGLHSGLGGGCKLDFCFFLFILYNPGISVCINLFSSGHIQHMFGNCVISTTFIRIFYFDTPRNLLYSRTQFRIQKDPLQSLWTLQDTSKPIMILQDHFRIQQDPSGFIRSYFGFNWNFVGVVKARNTHADGERPIHGARTCGGVR